MRSLVPFRAFFAGFAGLAAAICDLDQSKPPGDLTQCGNQTLFQTFRPKARFIAPEGWQNDPMGLFQRRDGSFHAGYQYDSRHVQPFNMSQGAAHSADLTFWEDFDWQRAATLASSTVYDIRSVYDGSIIPKGVDGNPTMIYAAESPYGGDASETQAIAYTTDGGASWTKLPFGVNGNPVIYRRPFKDWTALTGFRDPFAFQSPRMTQLLTNSTSQTGASGGTFVTVSGGTVATNGGSRLFLYRQTKENDFTDWTFLGPIFGTALRDSFSPWSGNFGFNFECGSVIRLNPTGRADDDGSDPDALDILGFGTEGGRNGVHGDHWPLWTAVDYQLMSNGSVEGTTKFAGVVDWGSAYAFVSFPVSGGRQINVGWPSEDLAGNLLNQQGYQGSFTLFRDFYVKITKNVDPSTPGLNDPASWGVRKENDGSTSVITVGQKVIPETLDAYKKGSKVSNSEVRSISQAGFIPFKTQPTGRHYAINARFEFQGSNGSLIPAGLRVLAFDQEFTDILYDPNTEELTIDRSNSTLIPGCSTITEVAKLKLFNIIQNGTSTREPMDLSVFVDGSVVEVYANDVAIITTRVYPWFSKSIGAGWLAGTSSGDGSVTVSNAELWDGLINAWPSRPEDTRLGLVWDGPAASLYGIPN